MIKIDEEVVIPSRIMILVCHLSMLTTVLWTKENTIANCMNTMNPLDIDHHFTSYHRMWLVAGLTVAIPLILIEFVILMLGQTMFSKTASMICLNAHGFGIIAIACSMLNYWTCYFWFWFWPIFIMSSVFPFCMEKRSNKYKVLFLDIKKTIGLIANEHQHLTQTHEYTPGWSFYLVLAGVVTTFGSSLPVGYNIGVVNTPADVIKAFCNESFITRYNLPLNETWLNVLWSSVVSIFIVGGCTGSILGSFLADKLGRKKATVFTSALSIAGALLFLLCRAANSVEMLIIGRLLVGLAGGLTTSIVPMYLTELSPSSLTGAMGVACPMGVNVGVLVGQVMGLNFLLGGVDNWPYLLSFYALLVIICLPVLLILPESPKYLFIVKRNEATSIKELSRLRGVSGSVLAEELDVLRDELRGAQAAAARGERWGMARLAREPRLRLPLLLVCSVQAGQQTSGINAVFYYSQTIFRQAGLSAASAQHATIGCGLVNVCTALLMLRLLPRRGRRPLLLASTLGAVLALAALAAAMTFIETISWMPYVCMIAVLLYVLVYGFGLGPIPYFIASEMFEVGPRPAAMAWGSLANWGGNFLVGMCFPTMRRALGPYSFLVFSAVTAALFLFVRAYFPETRGSSPAQVTQRCARGFRSNPRRAPHAL